MGLPVLLLEDLDPLNRHGHLWALLDQEAQVFQEVLENRDYQCLLEFQDHQLVLWVPPFQACRDILVLAFLEVPVSQLSILITYLLKLRHIFLASHLRNTLVPVDHSFRGHPVFQDLLVDLACLIRRSFLAYQAYLYLLQALVLRLLLFPREVLVDLLVPSYLVHQACHRLVQHLQAL